MESPVARILRECGTTNKPFRTRFGFSKGTLTYAIAGTFADLPGRLVDALIDLADEKNLDFRQIYRDYGVTTLGDAYHAWQSQERRGAVAGIRRATPLRFTDKHSPAHYFVHDSFGSVETFAKALKVPVATVSRWEQGFTKGVPAVIRAALTEIGYEHTGLLDSLQREWANDVAK